jgi:hypothetical protein
MPRTGNPPVFGALVTVKDSTGMTVGTCVTDSTGKCCVPVTADGNYTVNYASDPPIPVTVSGCMEQDVTHIVTNWGTCSVPTVDVCGTGTLGFCGPTTTMPVTMTLTGSLNLSFTLTNPTGGGFSPFPCPNDKTTFTVTYSAPGNTTISGPGNAMLTTQLMHVVDPVHYCVPGTGCITGIPASLTCTTNNDIFIWGSINNTTVSVPRTGATGGGATYQLDYLDNDGITTRHLVIHISTVWAGAAGNLASCPNPFTSTVTAALNAFTVSSQSGCPVAITATHAPATCTISG